MALQHITPKWGNLKQAQVHCGLSIRLLQDYVKDGLIRSALVTKPGAQRGVRLVDLLSLDQLIEHGIGAKSISVIHSPVADTAKKNRRHKPLAVRPAVKSRPGTSPASIPNAKPHPARGPEVKVPLVKLTSALALQDPRGSTPKPNDGVETSRRDGAADSEYPTAQ